MKAPGLRLRMVGYVRVSTEEQGVSGAGLESQRQTIVDECARKGWQLVQLCEDIASGRSLERPGLARARALIDSDQADGLVVAKLDRLSRSVRDFAGLLEDFQKQGQHLRILDPDVDTTSPSGRLLAHITSAVSEWERAIIGQRTTAALAVKRAQGVRLGRPPTVAEPLAARIIRARRRGLGWTAIARQLDADGVGAPRGGDEWEPRSVQAIVRRLAPGVERLTPPRLTPQPRPANRRRQGS